MIKFFRHIREHLLYEHKFSKYLLYAIGEIVLVMIGILLALQVNNWNDNRWPILAEKYNHERTTRNLGALTDEKISKMLDNFFFHHSQSIWYTEALEDALNEIKVKLNLLDDQFIP